MPKPTHGSGRYIAGLDGLRALAVLAVIAYHLNVGGAKGGLLGVGVFFVLSGYLITDLLLAEWSRNGKINLKDFWLRRARRLLPSMFLMLAAVVAWLLIVDRARLVAIQGDITAALLYFSNWRFIFHQVSYFESFGPPSPLGHLWSLAVEEQFYLLWPLLLALGLRLVPQRGKLAFLTLAGAVVSALAMAFLYEPGTDPSRVYYGTDTRSFALLIGAGLAILLPSQKLSESISRKARLLVEVVGGVGLLIVLYMMWQTNEYDASLYRGGMVVLSLASAAVVAALVHPGTLLGKAMSWTPLRWLGVRSYGMYLWHYPVIVLTTPAVHTGDVDAMRVVLQLAFCILLPALSWRYLEEPIRHGAIRKLWGQLREQQWRGVMRPRYWMAATCGLLVVSLIGFGADKMFPAVTASAVAEPVHLETAVSTTTGMEGSAPDILPAEMPSTSGEATPATNPEKETANKPTTSEQGSGTAENQAPKTNTPPPPPNTNPPATTKPPATEAPTGAGAGTPPASGAGKEAPLGSGKGVTAIGDSVLLDADPYLRKLLPGIVVDGKIGRQLYQATDVVTELKEKGELGDRVIIELGTNGPFSKKQLEALLNSLGDVKQILLVNSRVPRPWNDTVNSTLSEVATSYPNATLVDWYAASAGKDSYFYNDGVHLNPEGSEAYAQLVAKAVKSF